MSFQWIIDNAVDIQINKRGIVAQTTTRDQTVRAVSRGGRIWRFTVTPSPGKFWQDSRDEIEELDKLDRHTTATFNFGGVGLSYIAANRGTPPSSITVVQGSNVVTQNGSPMAGDFVQINGFSHVYTFQDSTHLNRPVLATTGTYGVTTGAACNFKVFCVDMPTYKITPLGIIEWSGPFTFMESLT